MKLFAIQCDGGEGSPYTIAIATNAEKAEELRAEAYGGNSEPPLFTYEFESDTYDDGL